MESFFQFIPPFPVLGTYIRTSDGRIFAIRAANKTKAPEESATVPPTGKRMNPDVNYIQPIFSNIHIYIYITPNYHSLQTPNLQQRRCR